jgi:hypothetical protein
MGQPLPEFLRGYCVLGLAPGSLVPLTAGFLAVTTGVILRSGYDWWHPLPPRDMREGGRLILQWGSVLGLGLLLYGSLQYLAGSLLPPPDKFGPALRAAIGCSGLALGLRALIRMQIAMFTPAEAHTLGVDPSQMTLTEIEMDAPHLALAAAPSDVAADTSFLRCSNVPSFLIGVVLLGSAITGWNTASLCLLRLPGSP